MGALYTAVDLTTVPSTCQENFPLIAAESLAMGTPVVGSAHGGTTEIVHDDENGYLVPPGDALALAERVIEHYARPAAWRRRMRLRCAELGRELVSWEKHLDRLGQVYSALV
jgi:glycosyltransferase involved in cell wall biosynthesis